MPIYTYECPEGHHFTRFLTVANHAPMALCDCGRSGTQRITAPCYVKASVDVRYDSPIDGQAITSHHARREDLKRSGCVPYDPEMKKDAKRFADASQSNLESAMEQTICEEVAKLSPAKKRQLVKEVVHMGMTPEVVRS